MIPIPNTELVTKDDSIITIISYHQGVCKAAKLNQTGYIAWQLIDGKRSIEEIISNMTSMEVMSNVSRNTIEKDINEFILALEKDGFLSLESNESEE